MNGLASRSNLSSNFLLNISQISSIKDYLRDNKKNENITIISENFHLIKFLIENFEKEYTLKVPKFLPIFLFIEKIYLVFQGLINYLKIIYYFITHYLFSFQTKPKKKIPRVKFTFFMILSILQISKKVLSKVVILEFILDGLKKMENR